MYFLHTLLATFTRISTILSYQEKKFVKYSFTVEQRKFTATATDLIYMSVVTE